jgi:SET domain-containing protein
MKEKFASRPLPMHGQDEAAPTNAADKIERRMSASHGWGVFARAPIPQGELIVTFTGPLWHVTEVDWSDYHLQVAEDYYLGPSGDVDDLINHSCDANAGFRRGLSLAARRDIEPGEEITMDYGAVIDEEGFGGFTCACGAATCRGMVRSFRDLPPAEQLQLEPWLLPYLVEKYAALLTSLAHPHPSGAEALSARGA